MASRNRLQLEEQNTEEQDIREKNPKALVDLKVEYPNKDQLHVVITADKLNFRLQVGWRSTYSQSVEQLMQQVAQAGLMQALGSCGLGDLAFVERSIQTLVKLVTEQLQVSYQGLPVARRIWGPKRYEAKQKLKSEIRSFCDEHQVGHPGEWFEFIGGFAAHLEEKGLRLCVLPQDQADREKLRESRRVQKKEQGKRHHVG